MDNAWIIAFYKETDPVKRLELLKANTGDGESEKDKYRKQLWIARYGKRTPVKDEFMRCLMEMKYLALANLVLLGAITIRLFFQYPAAAPTPAAASTAEAKPDRNGKSAKKHT